MKKWTLIFCLIAAFTTVCFANEVSSEQSAESQLEDVVSEAKENVPQRQTGNDASMRRDNSNDYYGRQHKQNAERKSINSLSMIIASTPLLTFGGWFFGFSGYLFSSNSEMNAAAGAPACIATGLALFTAGMALLLVGAIHLPRYLSQSDNAELARRLTKMNKTLENLTIVSGVFSATGLASLGMGIGFMCYGNNEYNNLSYAGSIFGTGVALTTIGTIFTFSFLPLFISSLSVFCANNRKIMSLSPEVAIIHDDKQSADRGYGVSVGMKVSL